jgi:hypothetical protein
LFAVGTALALLDAALLLAGFFVPWFHTEAYGSFRGLVPDEDFSPPMMLTAPPPLGNPDRLLPRPLGFLLYLLTLLGAGTLGVLAVPAAVRRTPAILSGGLVLMALLASVLGPFAMGSFISATVFAVAIQRSVSVIPDVGAAIALAGYASAFVASLLLLLDRRRARRTRAAEKTG